MGGAYKAENWEATAKLGMHAWNLTYLHKSSKVNNDYKINYSQRRKTTVVVLLYSSDLHLVGGMVGVEIWGAGG